MLPFNFKYGKKNQIFLALTNIEHQFWFAAFDIVAFFLKKKVFQKNFFKSTEATFGIIKLCFYSFE